MARGQILCLLFLAITAFVQSDALPSIKVKNGIAQVSRNLDIPFIPMAAVNSTFDDLSFQTTFSLAMNQSDQIDSNDETPMIISLYSSITALQADIGDGSDYCDWLDFHFTCAGPACTVNNANPTNISLPFFSSINASSLTFNDSTHGISLASGAWTLNTPPLYFTNCQYESDVSLTTTYGYGILGLGLGTNNGVFNTPNPTFSVIVDSDDEEAQIVFGINPGYMASGAPTVLTSNADWNMNLISVIFDGLTLPLSPSVGFIFDLQYRDIALPAEQYQAIMSHLKTLTNIFSCETDDDDSEALYDENEDDYCYLINDDPEDSDYVTPPILTFAFTDGSSLTLPASVYLDGDNYVRFHQFDTTYAGQNYTVLGAGVMHHFYTVFQQMSGVNTISLHPVVSGLFDGDYTYVEPTTTTTPTTTTPTTTTPTTTTPTTTTPTTTTPTTTTPTTTTPTTTIPETQHSTSNSSCLWIFCFVNSTAVTTPTTAASTASSNDEGSHSHTGVIVAVVIIVIVIGGAAVGFVGFKQGWWLQHLRPKPEVQNSSLGVELKSNGMELSNINAVNSIRV